MTAFNPIITHQADEFRVASATKALCSWVSACSWGAVIGAAAMLAFGWLLVPLACYLGLRIVRQKFTTTHAGRA